MKNFPSLRAVLLLCGLFLSAALFAAPSLHAEETKRSAMLASLPEAPSGPLTSISEDDRYKFVSRNFGAKGDQTPALFVFSKSAARWMQITQLSTTGAKLGRSPDPADGVLQVGWNHAELKDAEYAAVPLRTSGSISFPSEIAFDAAKGVYAFRFNTDWKFEYVHTVFYVRKGDLDAAFK